MIKKKKQVENKQLTPREIIKKKRLEALNRAEVYYFIQRLVVFVLLLWVLFGVVFGVTPMPNQQMKPRIAPGDLLFYYRFENRWHSGDVVVYEAEGETCIGRIVAMNHDSVEVTEQATLKINNSIVVEPEIYYTTPRYGEMVEYPIDLHEDEFFVLSDFREGAKDSRYYGVITRDMIKGKVITCLRRSGI